MLVAWSVLWIPPKEEWVESRLTTSIVALLSLIAYNFVFLDDIPKLDILTSLDLFVWSFLMTTAHGAGLMLIPGLADHSGHGMMEISKNGIFAMLFHMIGMVTVSITIAFSVYKIIGLRILRSTWINFDYIWSFVLIVGGIFVLFL